MDPILLYGFPMGSSTGLVAALEWLGRPYRLCRVDMLGEMLSPSYARINPRHETPALITDQGDVLTETMAIAAWLEARDTERRISFDPLSPQADRMHQLMAFVNTGFTGAFAPLWVAMEGVAMDDAMRSALREFGRRKVIERHDKLEGMIEPARFLLADPRGRLAGRCGALARLPRCRGQEPLAKAGRAAPTTRGRSRGHLRHRRGERQQ